MEEEKGVEEEEEEEGVVVFSSVRVSGVACTQPAHTGCTVAMSARSTAQPSSLLPALIVLGNKSLYLTAASNIYLGLN